jgi:hypothetical protein
MLVNFLYFQVLWFGCILLGNVFLPVALVIFLIHTKESAVGQNDLFIMLCCGVIGLIVDSILLNLNVFTFSHGQVTTNIIPPWLVAIWIAFGMTLNHSLNYFQNRPALAFVAGAFGGPLSYLAGAKLGAIAIPLGYLQTFIIFACIWAPLFFLLAVGTRMLNEYLCWHEPSSLLQRTTRKGNSNYV